jgi:hypothetical protein
VNAWSYGSPHDKDEYDPGSTPERLDFIILHQRYLTTKYPVWLTDRYSAINRSENTPDVGSDSPGLDLADRLRPMKCPPLAKSLK